MLRMTDGTVLLLLTMSSLWQVSKSAVLTPRNTLSTCPGDEIVVKCNESDATAQSAAMKSLRWTLTLQNKQTSMVEMTLSEQTNVSAGQLFMAGLELHFVSELTSYSPLSATLMTTAHPVLNGATVTCRTAADSMDTLTIRILETDQPEILVLNIMGEQFEVDNLTVIIDWEGNDGCLDFTVSLTPSNHTFINYNITTTYTSHTFDIQYNTNYTVTVVSSSGNYSSETTKTFNFIKCEQPSHRENVTISGYDFPALENSQISLSCPPGYGFPHREVTSTCTNEAMWSPDLSQLECQRDCGQLPSKINVYTILNDSYSTTVGSIIQFECVQTDLVTDLNKAHHQAECLKNGLWQPDLQTKCGRTTTTNGDSVRTIVLAVGIPLTLVCLVCLVGTAAVVLSCLVIRSRRKGSTEDEDNQRYSGSTQTGYNNLGQHYDYLFRAEDSQNRDNHTIEHWGIYSLLSQPEAESQSTRNSAVYDEVGPTPKGKRAAVKMPDTTVQYAVVKKKQKPQQCETVDLDMKVVLNLDELLRKIQSQVAPKWRQFGLAVRVPVETLNDLSTYQEEDRLSEMADYWMKQHQGQLTWKEVARIMKEIDLIDLAEEILSENTGDRAEFQEEDKASQDHQYQTVAELSSINLSDKHETETSF